MNSRAKKRLTRSWQDRDWNRNRRHWHRLPVPLGQSCYVILRTPSKNWEWQPFEKLLAGFVETCFFNENTPHYAVRDTDGAAIDFVSPHDLFESFEQANQEAERRNRQQ